MSKQLYKIVHEFHLIESRNLRMVIDRPVEKTERSKIAVLAVHSGEYIQSFPPRVHIAEHGFITAGVPLGKGKTTKEAMLDIKACVDYLKSYPGVEKLILMGHSQGGCYMSCYQYIAENGVKRFQDTDRIIPFPDIEQLTPGDGLMLVDANHGIMSMLAMDPAVKNFNGKERIPELDIYNPENGYNPEGSRYHKDFVERFEAAQVKFYNDILALAQQKAEDIRLGKGRFIDDDVILIPGSGPGNDNNKLFIQDNSLLGHTRNAHPLLHADGSVTNEVVHTCRVMKDSFHSDLYHRGSVTFTVNELLEGEMKFPDFHYNEDTMWGADWNFIPMSTRSNIKGISVPLLLEGNQGSHEYINIEHTWDEAPMEDKTIIFVEGSDHGFLPVKKAEKTPGIFGDPAATFAAFAADWLAKEGRFM